MNNNILFYFNWQLKPVHFGIVIEKLESIIEEQKTNPGKIYFLFCDGSLKPCYSNRAADADLCKICRFNSSVGLRKFKDTIKIISTSGYQLEVTESSLFSYNTVDEIKKLQYKGVQVGYGALSSYISFTRNLEPLIDIDFRNYFDRLLQSGVKLTDSVLGIIERENITQCYFFNGRTADTRPLYDICVTRNIPFTSLEMIKKADDKFFISDFVNCLPHDIEFHHNRMMKTWNNSADSRETKCKEAAAFFEKRRGGILVRDRTVYTGEQVSGLLPENWDKSKKNIAIFISSEDEFAAIGDIFEKLAVFKTQEAGIISILNQFKDDNNFHFIIRIHPNLGDVNYDYHHRIFKLRDNYANVTVIEATSKVSTYALIDAADKIIVFGTTVGVEACYWGKPAILLGGSFYYYLDVAYKPANAAELFVLLESDLAAKPTEEALKYGYYMMNFEQYSRENKFSPNELKLFGKKMGLGHRHLQVLGSKTLFRIIERILKRIWSGDRGSRLAIPVKERLIIK